MNPSLPARLFPDQDRSAQAHTDDTARENLRQRLLDRGPGALSDPELLTVLLDLEGLDLARTLLAPGGFGRLLGLSPTLLHYHGVPTQSLPNLLAAFELVGRVAAEEVREQPLLNRPALVARYLALHHLVTDREVFGALFLESPTPVF